MDAAATPTRTLPWQGWAIGLGLALVVNLSVPLLLSHLSRGKHTIDAPLPSFSVRLQRPPWP